MNFHFTHLFIWLKNGNLRKISFEPNKVNIITGGSNTGKTAILDIIDYCFFASKHNISEKTINENSAWYGLRFVINGKTYTIARKAPSKNEVSHEYFFSSVGDVPESLPSFNIRDATLKTLLSADFQIDQDTTISYGANTLRAGSKVSLRYFLMLNTISQDIITSHKEFFDKQSESRYRDALPRIFDLAVGIDTVENILKRDKRRELEGQLKKLQKQSEKLSDAKSIFHEELQEITKISTEFGLLDPSLENPDTLEALQEMIKTQVSGANDLPHIKAEEIKSEISHITLQIRNLRRFESEYNKYKDGLESTNDSLKPIQYLSENYSDLVRTSIFYSLVESLKEDQARIKKAVKGKTPLDSNVSDLIKDLQKKKYKFEIELTSLPDDIKSFETEKQKYLFLGETKAKLDLFSSSSSSTPNDNSVKILDMQKQISEITIKSTSESRDFFVTVLNETTQKYMDMTKSALVGYENYVTYFDYSNKQLFLRRPQAQYIENVGSSSNDMFLHLFMFLGLHELIISKSIPHVPSFLVIDQFSRPYYPSEGDEGANNKKPAEEIAKPNDVTKVKLALNLLNNFIERMVSNENNFQIIVFEHIPENYWDGLNHVHLVEHFQDGNALIPDEMA